MKPLKCGLAPRESEGEPFRYLPVKTPRPIGDQAKTPTFISILAGITSASIPRLSSEYSTWVETIGAFPKIGFCRVAALANCQPEKFETPTYLTRPEVTA